MKAVTLIFALCLLISFGGCLTGCTRSSEDEPTTDEVLMTEMDEADTVLPENKQGTENSEGTAAPTGKTQQAGETEEYKFETKNETSGKIDIDYPQLVNLSDKDTQNSINVIIKENAMKDKDYLISEAGEITYELNYEVMYRSFGLISIRYIGYSYVDGAAHPNNFLYTTNIDVKNQKVVELKDLININEGFVDVFKSGTYSSMFYDITPEQKEALEELLHEYDTAGWITNLTNADTNGIDNNLAVYSYLTENSLVISVSIPHVMGDFFEITINKKNLDGYKTNNVLWDDIFS